MQFGSPSHCLLATHDWAWAANGVTIECTTGKMSEIFATEPNVCITTRRE